MRFSKLGIVGLGRLILSISINVCFIGYIYADNDKDKKYYDAIHCAQQLGRLDIVSLLLGFISIILVLINLLLIC